MLTQERIRYLFDYCPTNGTLIWRVNRRGRFARQGVVAGNAGRYVRIAVDCKQYSAHSLIWLWHYGTYPNELDHINQNKHDNRIENLRLCSRSQNTGNVGLRSTNTTGFRGVWFAKHANKWRASIKVNGVSKHLGYFNTPELAAFAYDQAARIHFGEFAYLNISS